MRTLILLFFLGALQIHAQSLPDMYEQVAPGVVTIYASEVKNAGVGDPNVMTSNLGMGTGFVINKEGYIATAAHVVGDAENLMVEFMDGTKVEAKTVNISRMTDVALIKLRAVPNKLVPCKIGDSDKVKIGDPIFVVGAPLGLKHSLSTGIVSGKHKEFILGDKGMKMDVIQTDASINHGNSGGPMFNYNGEVIGIVSSILSYSGGFEGLGFAATVNTAKEQLKRKSSKYFGVDGILLTPEFCKILNVPQESGILVQAVIKNTPGYYAGLNGGYVAMNIGEHEILAGGDIILAVDDIDITSAEQFLKMQDYLDNPDKELHTIKILRSGKIKYLKWLIGD